MRERRHNKRAAAPRSHHDPNYVDDVHPSNIGSPDPRSVVTYERLENGKFVPISNNRYIRNDNLANGHHNQYAAPQGMMNAY